MGDSDYEEEDYELNDGLDSYFSESEIEEKEDSSSESDIDKKEDYEDESEEKTSILDLQEIKNIKNAFLQKPGKNEIIKYLIVSTFILKRGGKLIEETKDYNYPYTTEEGEAVESLLLGTVPLYTVKYNKIISINDYNKKDILKILKIVLRPCYENRKIVTEHLLYKFPLFFKNIFNDYISDEQLREVESYIQ